jgi:CHAT domain-containing protein
VVRKVLPTQAVLVEIARFNVFDLQAIQAKDRRKRWQPPHYAAWVIPAAGRGEVRVIDLGLAEAIDTAVAAARAALKADPQALQARGEPEVEQQARPPLEALARLVLTPLKPHIGTTRQWIISPDAALWLVPWAALPLDREKYAIEDHEIDYVISGRDLVQGSGQPSKVQAVVMADPDFELDPDQSRQAARAVIRQREESSSIELALRGLSSAFRLDAVPRLPGTAAEAQAIAPKLRAYTGAEPVLYTDQWALEAVFKAFPRPRVVVLSTHGFFLEDQEVKPEERPALGLDSARPLRGPLPENPLLRCGLLLAGCSRSDRKVQGEDEDGVLTGMEIVGTDLRGTELVVLSACETAVGQVRNGEGVAGLRQAFQLAGAQTVVATLWQVPDKESARLMVGFFDNLVKGQGKAEALRQAQLAQIQSRRERYGAAHPFFWAAYTITGNPGAR